MSSPIDLSNMTERERRLLALMGVFFGILMVALGVNLFLGAMDTKREEIERYEGAFDAMTEVAPIYLDKKASTTGEQSRFRPEVLVNNDIQLTSFVATHASAVDLKVDNYDEKKLPLSDKKGGPIIVEYTVRANVRQTEMAKLLKLLERIEKSPEPVIIKRVTVRDVRNKPGDVRTDFVIASYIQKEEEK